MNSQRYQELLGRQSDDPVVELDNLSDSGSVRPNDSASNRSGEPQPGKLITLEFVDEVHLDSRVSSR